VLTLFWVYYAGLILFIGALLTAIMDERSTRRMPSGAVNSRSGSG
jgi:uncharacterized BrkB/YihY/UPF0761 family membrane protein